MSYGPGIETRAERFVCRRCGHELGTLRSGYESGALTIETPLEELGPQVAGSAEMRLLVHLCPECGQSLKMVSARHGGGVPPDRRDVEAGESDANAGAKGGAES